MSQKKYNDHIRTWGKILGFILWFSLLPVANYMLKLVGFNTDFFTLNPFWWLAFGVIGAIITSAIINKVIKDRTK